MARKRAQENTTKTKRGGIFWRTFIASFLFSALIIATFALTTYNKHKNSTLKILESQASSLASSITHVCGNSIKSDEYEQIMEEQLMLMVSRHNTLMPEEREFIVEHCLEVLKNNEDLAYLLVVHNNGFTLAHTPGEWEQLSRPDPMWGGQFGDVAGGRLTHSNLVKQRVYHYSYPMLYSGLNWGWIHVGLSVDRLKKELRDIFGLVALLTLSCLAFNALGSWFFVRRLTRPILSLLESTRRIKAGDMTARAEVSSFDELGQLAISFNEMARELQRTTVSKDFMDDIIENMTETLVVASPFGRIQMANRAAEKLLGYDQDELLNQPLDVMFETPDGFSLKQWVIELSEKGFERNQERVFLTKTGDKIPVLFSAALMHETNVVNAIVCIAQDISDRIKTEQSLQKAYDEIRATQAQLVQAAKLASIGELAAGVAHELNQPLMVIRTTAQYLLRTQRKGSLSLDMLGAHLAPLEKNTFRMMSIINHLRAFSHQSQGSYSPLEPNRVIDECLLMMGEQLRVHDININMDLEPGLPVIKGDANQLEQVLLNLITNARDAINARGKEGPRNIAISGKTSGAFLEIRVRDTGCGIPPDKIDSIFDPFFTTKEVGKGTGLGLSISYGIVRDHGGEITVEHTGPEGTVFLISLPVDSNEGEEAPGPEGPTGP